MLSFAALLREVSVDPKQVRLARHGDRRHERTPYDLWRADQSSFELYQRIQSKPRFADAKKIASFVVTPLGETLFVGLYSVNGVYSAPAGTIDPISSEDAVGKNLYTLTFDPAMSELAGRVVIEWGEGYLAWVQLGTNDKSVLEIRRNFSDPPFPGFMEFRWRRSVLGSVPLAWREALAAVSGVYLFVRLSDGKQYVGCAIGEGGFWARWQQYAASGHGGNQRMRDIDDADYQITILEVASSSADRTAIYKMESLWKEKLMSRRYGLNAN